MWKAGSEWKSDTSWREVFNKEKDATVLIASLLYFDDLFGEEDLLAHKAFKIIKFELTFKDDPIILNIN